MRDRVLYNLVLFVLLIIACAILLGDLTDGHEARTIVNIGLNAMLVFGTFIAIFVGVGLVSKEIEKRVGVSRESKAGAAAKPEATFASPRTHACSSCGTQNDRDARFCKNCGGKLEAGS